MHNSTYYLPILILITLQVLISLSTTGIYAKRSRQCTTIITTGLAIAKCRFINCVGQQHHNQTVLAPTYREFLKPAFAPRLREKSFTQLSSRFYNINKKVHHQKWLDDQKNKVISYETRHKNFLLTINVM